MMKKQTRLLALVLAVVMLFGLAACGGNATPTESTGAGTANGTETVASASSDHVLRFAIAQDIETLDSQQNTAEYTASVAEGVTASLLRENNGEYLPDLAESYDTDDFITWTFHIREDAAWSDGTPITAQDFVYSYKQIFLRDECGKVYVLFDGIKGYDAISEAMAEGKSGDDLAAVVDANLGVEAVDDHTLVIELVSARPWYVSSFASPYMGPIKQDVYEANGSKYGSSVEAFACSGPFYIDNWSYNEKVVLKPNSYYWDAENIQLDGVEIYIVQDVEPRVNLFKDGTLHFTRASSEYYTTMADSVVTYEGSNWTYILTNQNRLNTEGELVNKEISDLLANRDFVMALSYCIDRSVVYGSVVTDPTKEGTTLIVSGHLPLNDGEGTLVEDARAARNFDNPFSLTADPDVAAQYLQKAMDALGYTDASQIPEITLVVAQGTDNVNACDYISLAAEQYLGLKITVEPVEFGVRDSRIISGDYDLLLMGWGIDGVDGSDLFLPWYSDLFATGWPTAHPEEYEVFVEMMDDLNTTSDFVHRGELLLEIEEYLLECGPFITLCFSGDCGLMSAQVSGFYIREAGATYNYAYASVN